jgi:hypothetical protein
VTIFPETRATRFAAVKPALYVKGGDYNSDTLNQEERAVLENWAEVRLIPFEPGYSTSRLIERICTTTAKFMIDRQFVSIPAKMPIANEAVTNWDSRFWKRN